MTFFSRITLLLLLCTITAFSSRAVTAGFTADVTAGCAPLVVHFTNTSTGASTYTWDFGTGTTSVLKDVSTSFTKPGTYIVKMTATGAGGSSTFTMTITVYPSPTVSFTASPSSACPGAPITFTSTTIGGVPGPITYVWAFGDGSTSSLTTPTHAYARPGTYNITLTATNAMGCTSSLTMPAFVTIYNPPVPDFSAATTYFCKAPGHAVFTNYSSGAPTLTYSWEFGDGGKSTATNPTNDYTAFGSYSVKLVVTDGNGCMDSITKVNYITVANIKASFTTPATACVNTAVTFTNTSTPHVSDSWDYGDGAKDNTGVHTYGTAGTYTVTLVIFDGTCYDTIAHSITILPGPIVSFTQSPLQPCPPPVGITFTGSVPSGTTVAWDFGDLVMGSGNPVTHTYGRRGIYKITMTGTNPGTGCKSFAYRTDTLYDMEFRVIDSPSMGCKPLTVKFKTTAVTHEPDTTKSYPYPFPVLTYTWNFGDGSPVVTGTGTPSHTYTTIGTFRPYCTITTSNGCTFTDTGTVWVGAPPVITLTAVPSHVCYGKPVTYIVTVVSGPVDLFHWQMDDWFMGGEGEKFDTAKTLVYIDQVPGVFTVTVTPSYHGCVGVPVVMPNLVTVDSPKAWPTGNTICIPANTVQFFDSSMGDDSWLWVFGDGTTSTVKNPLHTYPSPTLYTGYLATYNAKSGCRDTAKFAYDFTVPVTTLFYKPNVCLNAPDTLSVTSVGSVASYDWCGSSSHFRYVTGGICAAGAVVYDSFSVSGVQTVTLTTTYVDGCKGTQTIKINVAHPGVTFTATPTSGCWPLSVTFSDASVDAPGFTLTSYAWAFGDGSTSTVTSKTTVHTFVKGGTFATKEIVTDNIGCKDSATLPLVTVWRPHADFFTLNQFPCVGDSIQFINKTVGAVSSFWMFGDGGTSTLTSPWHTYAAKGTYTVRLAVVDAHGCTDTAVFTSYISASQPDVSFYMIDSFAACTPLITNFYNTSTGVSFYSWDLGDGSFSTLTNPSDLYTVSKTYSVTLTGTDSHGCKSVAHGYPTVFGSAGTFSYTPLKGCSPLTVHFKAQTSNVPNIIWDFSDGTTSKLAYTDTTDHVYTLPGSYIPRLILSDNTGCQNSADGLDTIKVDLVTPDYTSIPFPVCAGDTVNYKDKSTSYFSTITSWLWTLPDASANTTPAFSYYYPLAGTYPITLLVTDGWGCTGNLTANITVHPPPVITASPDTVICVSDAATLTGYGGATYSWSPPVALGCTNCNPAKASPLTVTTYTVVGTDQFGCKNFDTVMVSLKTKTVSHATGDTEVCRGVVVQLHDSGGTSYLWIPATGLSSALIADPFAAPPTTERYQVVAYLGSCVPDTATVWVTIHPLPTVEAGPSQRLVEGSVAQLHATGTFIEKYSWAKDPTLSCDSCFNPEATMSVTTTYYINVYSSFGCKASDTVTITIYCDKSQIFVPNTFTPNGDGENDVLYPRGKGISVIKSFRIYNRWGNLLFERAGIQINDAANAWDGSYQGSMPRPDVYVYVLDAVCETGEPINIKGDVTIIR